MAIVEKEVLMQKLKTTLGDDDNSISLLEDISDTINDYSTRLNESGDWKAKYDENDKQWRERYRERFFEGDSSTLPVSERENKPEPESKPKTRFEELFTFS